MPIQLSDALLEQAESLNFASLLDVPEIENTVIFSLWQLWKALDSATEVAGNDPELAVLTLTAQRVYFGLPRELRDKAHQSVTTRRSESA